MSCRIYSFTVSSFSLLFDLILTDGSLSRFVLPHLSPGVYGLTIDAQQPIPYSAATPFYPTATAYSAQALTGFFIVQ